MAVPAAKENQMWFSRRVHVGPLRGIGRTLDLHWKRTSEVYTTYLQILLLPNHLL
jgi:hypothetical protein